MVNVRLWNTVEVRMSKNIPPRGPTQAFGPPRSDLVTAETHQLTSGHLGEKKERKGISEETEKLQEAGECEESTPPGKDVKQLQMQQ